MKKLLLIFILTVFFYSASDAQFYKDASTYGFGIYAGPLITYGQNPQSTNDNLNLSVSSCWGISFSFRLADRILLNTGLELLINTFSEKAYEDTTYNSIGLKAVHVKDEYLFWNFNIPVGLKAAVLNKETYYITVGASTAINGALVARHTLTPYDEPTHGWEVNYFGDGWWNIGYSFSFDAAFNYPVKKKVLSIEPFWTATHSTFHHELDRVSSTTTFNFRSVGIRFKIKL